MSRIILDLCGGTGSWSKPYADAGYDVRVIDFQEWLGGNESTGDVRLMEFLQGRSVHGILAAPPCTHLARSGAIWWAKKGPAALLEGLAVADACCRIALLHRPKWWALENPEGRIRRFYGPPRHTFNPCDYGDPWTKKTLLWGDFAIPAKQPVASDVIVNWVETFSPGPNRARLRSATPPGFAQAFFEANP